MKDRRLAILAAAGSLSPIAHAQPCVDGWRPGFHVNDLPSSYTQSLAVYDDGSGPALYVGGRFSAAGDVATGNIVKWTGSNWVRVSQSMQVAPGIDPRYAGVRAMLAFDPDGPGPQNAQLIAAGEFAMIDGLVANRIAAWDGQEWHALGQGLPSSCAALTEFEGRLVATGGGSGSGFPPPYLLQWNGQDWQDVGGGIAGAWSSALAVHDDGHGPGLYVAGYLTHAGTLAVGSIARWDGTAWHDLATPLYPGAPDIRALASFHGDLYAGGSVGAINASSRGLCRWDGSAWFPVDPSLFDVTSLAVIEDRLYVGAEYSDPGFPSGLATWDGAVLARIPGAFSSLIKAIAPFDEGHGPRIFATVGSHVGDVITSGLARWDGAEWSRVGPLGGHGCDEYNGSNSSAASITALAGLQESGRTVVYAGGSFLSLGGDAINRIARWDGTQWSSLGTGLGTSPGDFVSAICAYSGDVYAAGHFTGQGSVLRWDGSRWTPARSSGTAYALAVYDDGSGPALYVALGWLQRWNGSEWSVVPGSPGDLITSLAVFQGQLVAGGYFTSAGGLPASGVAAWDGTSWRSLGSGVSPEIFCGCWQTCDPYPQVLALAAYDDDSGPSLIVAGMFRTAGGLPANGLARWDGASWSVFGSGLAIGPGASCARAYALGAYNGALFVSGDFDSVNGVSARGLARWRNGAWSSLGSGLEWYAGGRPAAYAFANGPVEGQSALMVAGTFVRAGNRASSGIGAWVECPAAPCYANCDRSDIVPILNVNDFICFLNRFAVGDSYANCDRSSNPPTLNTADFLCFLNQYAAGCP